MGAIAKYLRLRTRHAIFTSTTCIRPSGPEPFNPNARGQRHLICSRMVNRTLQIGSRRRI